MNMTQEQFGAGLLAFLRRSPTPYHAAGNLALLLEAVSYTHLRAHETVLDLVCRLLLEKKK